MKIAYEVEPVRQKGPLSVKNLKEFVLKQILSIFECDL